jgi:hypothetical protein
MTHRSEEGRFRPIGSLRLGARPFGHVARAPQLVQQPDAVDRDGGLVSKSLNQSNLFVGEWSDFQAINTHDTEQIIAFKYWY